MKVATIGQASRVFHESDISSACGKDGGQCGIVEEPEARSDIPALATERAGNTLGQPTPRLHDFTNGTTPAQKKTWNRIQ